MMRRRAPSLSRVDDAGAETQNKIHERSVPDPEERAAISRPFDINGNEQRGH